MWAWRQRGDLPQLVGIGCVRPGARASRTRGSGTGPPNVPPLVWYAKDRPEVCRTTSRLSLVLHLCYAVAVSSARWALEPAVFDVAGLSAAGACLVFHNGTLQGQMRVRVLPRLRFASPRWCSEGSGRARAALGALEVTPEPCRRDPHASSKSCTGRWLTRRCAPHSSFASARAVAAASRRTSGTRGQPFLGARRSKHQQEQAAHW